MTSHETLSENTDLPQTYDALVQVLLPPSTPAPLLQPPSPSSSNRPRPVHPELATAIAALQLHPCIESLLHILNADLASAHFLVRHMQAPSMLEGMFLHGILHRIEGDANNAKAWYGDVTGSGVFEYVWAQDSKAADSTLADRVNEAERVAQKAKAEQAKHQQGEKDDKQDQEIKASSEAGILTIFGHAEAGSEDAKRGSATLADAESFLSRASKLQKSVNKERGESSWESEHEELLKLSEREVRRLLKWLETRFGTDKWEDATSEFPKMAGKYAEMATKQLVGGEGFREF